MVDKTHRHRWYRCEKNVLHHEWCKKQICSPHADPRHDKTQIYVYLWWFTFGFGKSSQENQFNNWQTVWNVLKRHFCQIESASVCEFASRRMAAKHEYSMSQKGFINHPSVLHFAALRWNFVNLTCYQCCRHISNIHSQIHYDGTLQTFSQLCAYWSLVTVFT